MNEFDINKLKIVLVHISTLSNVGGIGVVKGSLFYNSKLQEKLVSMKIPDTSRIVAKKILIQRKLKLRVKYLKKVHCIPT